MAGTFYHTAGEFGSTAEERSRHAKEHLFFRRLFEQHAEETVTDEQVQRVLAPVLLMIREGKFDRPKPHHAVGGRLGLAALGVAACLVLGLTFGSGRARVTGLPDADAPPTITLKDTPVPLADPALPNRFSGRVQLPKAAAGGLVMLRLVNAATGEVAATTLADESGAYTFEGFPDGSYRVEMALPGGKAGANWAVAESDLTFGKRG